MRYVAAALFEIELRSANQRRHWSPASQSYAPADVLLEYLANGWKLSSIAGRAEHWYGAGRHVDIYYFELTCGHRMMVMPVQGNPAVHRLVWEQRLRIVPLSSDERLSEGESSEVYSARAEVEHLATAVRGRQDFQQGRGVKELAVSWHQKTSKRRNKVARPLPLWVIVVENAVSGSFRTSSRDLARASISPRSQWGSEKGNCSLT